MSLKRTFEKEKTLAEAAALLVLKKSEHSLRGQRGRLIPAAQQNHAIELLDEAVSDGASLINVCEVLDYSQNLSEYVNIVVIFRIYHM